MSEVAAESTRGDDFNMLLVVFGGSALVLAIIGIYGLIAYSGRAADPGNGSPHGSGSGTGQCEKYGRIKGMWQALIGVGIGIVAALGLSRFISSFLFGVPAWDPIVFTAVPILLSAAAPFAVWLPARRAARTNLTDAVRHVQQCTSAHRAPTAMGLGANSDSGRCRLPKVLSADPCPGAPDILASDRLEDYSLRLRPAKRFVGGIKVD